MEENAAGPQHPHPYVPSDLSLPGYIPVLLSQSTICSVFVGASLLVISLVWILSGFNLVFARETRIFDCIALAERFIVDSTVAGGSPRKSRVDRLLMCWWAFTGLSHMILEGYFVFSPEFYKNSSGYYLAEVWKEYSKGDSRYAARDPGIVSIIGLTAVLVGPACILAVYAIAKNMTYSYVLQFAVSLGHLYVNAMLFITAFLQGDNFATSPFYYYAYYAVPNSFWFLIPAIISVRCWKKICAALQFQAQSQHKAKSR